MKIRNIGSNQTEIDVKDCKILFSYDTPVAADMTCRLIRTSEYHSTTTSRHINRWLDGREAEEVPQVVLDALAED